MEKVSKVVDVLISELCPEELNIRFSKSGSAYISAAYTESRGVQDVINVRVSNHEHPTGFNGLNLCGDTKKDLKTLSKAVSIAEAESPFRGRRI